MPSNLSLFGTALLLCGLVVAHAVSELPVLFAGVVLSCLIVIVAVGMSLVALLRRHTIYYFSVVSMELTEIMYCLSMSVLLPTAIVSAIRW